jgi:hypothetical protein
MPEIQIDNHSFSFQGLSVHGPEVLFELGFRTGEVGENSQDLFELGVRMSSFINDVSRSSGEQKTINYFWVKNQGGLDTMFLKIPIGINTVNAKSGLLMMRATPKDRIFIQNIITNPATSREKIQSVIGSLLTISGSTVDPANIHVPTIAYLSDAANSIITTATKRATSKFDTILIQGQASKVQFLHPRVNITPSLVESQTSLKEPTPQVARESQNHVVDTKDISPVILDLDKDITHRVVLNKWVGSVNIHGVQLTQNDHNLGNTEDFHYLPAGITCELIDPSLRMTALRLAHKADQSKNEDPQYQHFPAGVDYVDRLCISWINHPTDAQITRLMFASPVYSSDWQGRLNADCTLFCDIPSASLSILIGLVIENPDNAEMMVRTFFQGIDETNAQRQSVLGVALIDLKNYIPNEIVSGIVNLLPRMNSMRDKLNPNAVKTFEYSRPMP